ncbi:MAG: 2-succinyl-5-enolpyruvyl-6-hydroxy-3-cyclohexene-1-carboxylic-acid synthase [Fimbriimonadaceae bacterium]
MNSDLATHVLDQLWLVGVNEVCVCPGGRNAPLVEALIAPGCRFKVTWHFEERSAAFFALGRSRATGRPVAVCTTSGTAAGELLPATMEAYYSGSPLVLLTADRPRRFRGSGAPQAAEQRRLFGEYTGGAFDLECDDRIDLTGFVVCSPLHINVCFEEPKAEPMEPPSAGTQRVADEPARTLSQFFAATVRPVVVVGSLTRAEQQAVEQFLLALGAPVYAEGPSGLRESDALEPLRLNLGDQLFQRAAATGYPVDGVLRIGGVPTARLWRDLEDRHPSLPVLSLSALPFSGLGRPSDLCCGGIGDIMASVGTLPAVQRWQPLKASDRQSAAKLKLSLEGEPQSEAGLVHELSKCIEEGANVFLGNSLPVREWDLAATRDRRGYQVFASRGLNGIDGQVSTFLGLSTPGAPNWAILGDLTTLYDLAGPWVRAQLDPAMQATIVVLNNAGGRIFNRMFAAPEFQNAHGIAFDRWAGIWGMPYQVCHSIDDVAPASNGVRVIELRPDSDATARFWRRYEECLA